MKSSLALSAVLLVLSSVASAETFRCGQWVISGDLTLAEILEKCGEPTTRKSTTEDVLARNQYGLMVKVDETTLETWTYDRGANPAMVVTIVDGHVKSLERLK